MEAGNRETLFQEHWRRFYQFPLEDCRTSFVSDALFWNDQMAWSLGIIPWRAWRYPFQKAMLPYLRKHCPHQAALVYDAINTALVTAHGDYFSLPDKGDREKFLETVGCFCSENRFLPHKTSFFLSEI